jgi:hypothetical protein
LVDVDVDDLMSVFCCVDVEKPAEFLRLCLLDVLWCCLTEGKFFTSILAAEGETRLVSSLVLTMLLYTGYLLMPVSPWRRFRVNLAILEENLSEFFLPLCL